MGKDENRHPPPSLPEDLNDNTSFSEEKDTAAHTEMASRVDSPADAPSKLGTSATNQYHGIDTTAIRVGENEMYERKVAVMNQALIDLGMGPFQWKIFAMTGFGWFVDNVSLTPFLHRARMVY